MYGGKVAVAPARVVSRDRLLRHALDTSERGGRVVAESGARVCRRAIPPCAWPDPCHPTLPLGRRAGCRGDAGRFDRMLAAVGGTFAALL